MLLFCALSTWSVSARYRAMSCKPMSFIACIASDTRGRRRRKKKQLNVKASLSASSFITIASSSSTSINITSTSSESWLLQSLPLLLWYFKHNHHDRHHLHNHPDFHHAHSLQPSAKHHHRVIFSFPSYSFVSWLKIMKDYTCHIHLLYRCE